MNTTRPAIIIFCPGSEMRWETTVKILIYINFFITFPPPPGQWIQNGKIISNMDTFTFYFDKGHVTDRICQIRFICPPVRMEIIGIVRPFPGRNYQIRFQRYRKRRIVMDTDLTFFLVRHNPTANHPSILANFPFPGPVRINRIDISEKIT